MSINHRDHKLPAILFIIISIVFIVSIAYIAEARVKEDRSNTSDSRKKWVKMIGAIGPQKAYEELKNEYADDLLVRHAQLHLFGEALFEKFGFSGISYCDNEFRYGCHHGVVVLAISRYGLGVVDKFEKICAAQKKEEIARCEHGLGHGIMEYLGHDKLIDALKICEKIADRGPLFGCVRGVLMEYNLPVDVKTSTMGVRKLDKNNPYSVCPTLPAIFKLSCYHELTRWWTKVFDRDYKEMGKLCQEIEEAKIKEVCFWGLGFNALSSAEYDIPKAIDFCKLMPDDKSELLCRSGVRFTSSDDKILHKSSDFCQDLQGEKRRNCLDEIDKLILQNEK